MVETAERRRVVTKIPADAGKSLRIGRNLGNNPSSFSGFNHYRAPPHYRFLYR